MTIKRIVVRHASGLRRIIGRLDELEGPAPDEFTHIEHPDLPQRLLLVRQAGTYVMYAEAPPIPGTPFA